MVSHYSIETLKLLFSHQVNDVPEIPLVVDSLQVSKTKELLKILYALGCEDELATILETKKIRPAGHLGRFVIWTKDAFEKLNSIFGNRTNPGVEKKGYILERPMLTNANIARIINSDDIQSVVKPMEKNKVMHDKQKKNPLTNKVKMDFLNPYKKELREEYKKKQQENKDKHAEIVKKRLERKRAHRKGGRKFISSYRKELEGANQETIKEYKNYIKSTKIGKAAFAEE